MHDIPRGWTTGKLESLVWIKSGSAAHFDPLGSIPVMGANGQIGRTSQSNFGPGYLVGRVGAAGAVNRVDGPCWASDNVLTVLARDHVMDESFLGHLLRYANPAQLATRQAQPLITQTNLGALRVRYPICVGEQRRIAEILDALDEQINCERRLADKLQSVSLGIIESIFEGMVDGPVRGLVSNEDRRQEECALGDLGTWLSGGTPSTSDPGFWGGEIPWISAASMKDFYISDSDRKVTQSGASAGTRLVPSGTVLFVVRGMSLKKEFRVGVTVREVAFGQDCKAIIPRDDIDGTFLALALRAKSQLVLRMVDEAGHGTGRLPTDAIAKMRITVPPFTAQRRIVDTVQAFDRRLNAQMVTLEKLLLLRQGLAEDLLTGRVRVPEAEAVVESL